MTQCHDDEQLKRIDAALESWRQGDCVIGEHWFVHRFDRNTPLTRVSADAANQGVDIAESEVRGFVVVTQSCDIVRSCGERPYVQVAPLVDVEPGRLQEIKRGQRPQYAFVPALEGRNLVGDLDRVMTVEKSVVAAWVHTEGCKTDQARRRLAQALSRKRRRFAFPDDFTTFVGELQGRLQHKHDRQSTEGEALRGLREIRVRAAPSWNDDQVELMFWFIRCADEPDFNGVSWHDLLEGWLNLVPASGRFRTVDGMVASLDDLTASDYVESDPLDLDHLSF